MFDTMTLTKVLGGLCGTFLIYLLGGWFAEIVYHGAGGGHEGEEYAYVIEAEEDDGGGGSEEEGPTFEEVFASADPAEGEGLFRACQACHAVEDGNNGVGPHLYGVVGREVASVAGFSYSGALVEAADAWTPENLNGFLENPSGYAPGTAMGYSGMRRLEDRANLIAWLDTIGG